MRWEFGITCCHNSLYGAKPTKRSTNSTNKKVAHGYHKLWQNRGIMAITSGHSSRFKTCHPKNICTKKHQMGKSLGSTPSRTLSKTQPHWLVADWLGLMEPMHGKSCLSGQRRDPAIPGEDKESSPDQKSFHISTNPMTWGRKRRSPRSIPPRTVWKLEPHGPVVDWLGLMEPARGESCLSGQR